MAARLSYSFWWNLPSSLGILNSSAGRVNTRKGLSITFYGQGDEPPDFDKDQSVEMLLPREDVTKCSAIRYRVMVLTFHSGIFSSPVVRSGRSLAISSGVVS